MTFYSIHCNLWCLICVVKTMQNDSIIGHTIYIQSEATAIWFPCAIYITCYRIHCCEVLSGYIGRLMLRLIDKRQFANQQQYT